MVFTNISFHQLWVGIFCDRYVALKEVLISRFQYNYNWMLEVLYIFLIFLFYTFCEHVHIDWHDCVVNVYLIVLNDYWRFQKNKQYKNCKSTLFIQHKYNCNKVVTVLQCMPLISPKKVLGISPIWILNWRETHEPVTWLFPPMLHTDNVIRSGEALW